MIINVDTTDVKNKKIAELVIASSKLLNNIIGSAEYALLLMLLDEVSMLEADNNIDREEIPLLTNFKNVYDITYLEAGQRIRAKYLTLRTKVSEQLVAAYKEIDDMRE